MTTITIVNPFSGAQVERDVTLYTERDLELFAGRMSDDEVYVCELTPDSLASAIRNDGYGGPAAMWVANMVAKLGQVRAGEIILS